MTHLTVEDIQQLVASLPDKGKREALEHALRRAAFSLVSESETGLDGVVATIHPHISPFDYKFIEETIERYSGIKAIMIQGYRGSWNFTAAGWEKK